MSCEYCKYQHLTEDEEPCVDCSHAHPDRFEPMPQPTNADYIRNMSDEELASFLWQHFSCPPEGKCPIDNCDGYGCKGHIRKWLQEERKADNDCK